MVWCDLTHLATAGHVVWRGGMWRVVWRVVRTCVVSGGVVWCGLWRCVVWYGVKVRGVWCCVPHLAVAGRGVGGRGPLSRTQQE